MNEASAVATINNRGWRQRWQMLNTVFGPWLIVFCVAVFFTMADWIHGGRGFASLQNLRTITVQTSTVAVAALGMTLIIISGGIDLSAGTAMALCATVLAWCLKHDMSMSVALAACIATGCLAGFVNGTLISTLRLVPFIVTLGTMSVYLGVSKLIADNSPVRPLPEQVPDWVPRLLTPRPQGDAEWLIRFGDSGIPNLATCFWVMVALAIGVSLVLRYSVFGRHVFALGSNEATARLCGIHVPLTKIAVYTLAGAMIGVAGLFQFARISSGDPTAGTGRELQMIAAVVIGGGSLNGGRGTVLGTLAGAALMGMISTACSNLGVANAWQDIIVGAVIVIAAAIDQLRQRHLEGN